ncbi:Uncharacterised protein [Salmonella enterica subsp. enterica serovar Bovismorbificans]|uniref:Uncharacterized protein n=1 Tax=Salmonella enterica subsp. enterica serovar Bovismorbificans TaxID=58097 RepID=A0A655BMP5_SALET|nr:Uncharacterised protein [Salmonella enterica subsp. enterica serovar Bovismorbificans]
MSGVIRESICVSAVSSGINPAENSMNILLRGKIESGYYVRKQWRAVCYLGLRDGLAPLHTLRIFLYSKIE